VSPDGYYTTAVVTLDAAAIQDVLASVAVLANASTIYASTEAVYVTDADYTPSNAFREKTAIHKFRFDENGAARYVASGQVPGRLLNQFSLGEHESYLRVATHVTAWTDFPVLAPDDVASSEVARTEQPYNGVYVLGESASKLEVVGAVDGLAPGESIYAARFLGPRGFLVTFRQIDPLFALDLSDPAHPAVVGELKIPGYSDYLHPLGENHLIGVGRSTARVADDRIVRDALQLSLFDVSNLAHPRAVQQLTIGGSYSYSEASYTHKAFVLYEHAGRTLLAIPTVLQQDSYPFGLEFEGVLCFQVDPAAGFAELGRLESVRPADDALYNWSGWQRPAFIGADVYAVSAAGVRTANLADFGTTHGLALAP
jgi:uncharacterized secreted protein with C-terminal beta-propeller domain